jgi:hypothetical protein
MPVSCIWKSFDLKNRENLKKNWILKEKIENKRILLKMEILICTWNLSHKFYVVDVWLVKRFVRSSFICEVDAVIDALRVYKMNLCCQNLLVVVAVCSKFQQNNCLLYRISVDFRTISHCYLWWWRRESKIKKLKGQEAGCGCHGILTGYRRLIQAMYLQN